jgi:electron transfer flavoprotein alpha/beta subunit
VSGVACAVWLGTAAPERSIRWLDGALGAGAKLGTTTALAAGKAAWLDLAADRAGRAKLASAGVATELELDYLGWAQVAAAMVRQLGSTLVLVDEASRPERFAEVAAIADQLDAVQLTRVVAIAFDGTTVHASRVHGRELQTVRLRGPAVIGVRIAGSPIDEYPTPMPSAAMKHLELGALGLDPLVLGHRALPPRAPLARKTMDRVLEHLASYVPARGGS